MESLIYPDAKKTLVTYLQGRTDAPVMTRVPQSRPASFVRVLLAGGAGRVGPVLEDVSFTVESWDNDEAAAARRAQEVRDLIRRAYVMDGHPVYGYSEYGPPVDLPDESNQWRYTWTFSIRMRPVNPV